jgi:hypothetical protein
LFSKPKISDSRNVIFIIPILTLIAY